MKKEDGEEADEGVEEGVGGGVGGDEGVGGAAQVPERVRPGHVA